MGGRRCVCRRTFPTVRSTRWRWLSSPPRSCGTSDRAALRERVKRCGSPPAAGGSASAVAMEAQELAARAGNFLAYVYATVWAINGVDGGPTPAVLDQLRRS